MTHCTSIIFPETLPPPHLLLPLPSPEEDVTWLESEIQKTHYGSILFGAMSYILFVPFILVSSLGIPVLTFLLSANIFDPSTNRYLNIAIGLLSIFITFSQTLLHYGGFSAKQTHLARHSAFLADLRTSSNLSAWKPLLARLRHYPIPCLVQRWAKKKK